jgi:DNA-binding CsgD family transcriptional regulator
MVIANNTRPAAVRAISQLDETQRGAKDILREVTRIIRPVIPFDTGSWLLYDPDALLPVGRVPIDDAPTYDLSLRFCANEHLQDDVNKFRDLVRRHQPAATLEQATDGRPGESRRYREILEPLGLGHELRLALVSRGSCWGSLTLRRESRAPPFTSADVSFAASIAAPVADRLSQTATVAATVTSPSTEPGVIVLDDTGAIVSATSAGREWLGLLERRDALNPVPLALGTLAVQTLARPDDADRHLPRPSSRLRVRARTGQWLVLDGAPIHDPESTRNRIAVVIQAAPPGVVLSMVAKRYGLTPREQAVVGLIVRGLSTGQIAEVLQISPLTVQDHLKAIFDKTGVSSRRVLAFQLALLPL